MARPRKNAPKPNTQELSLVPVEEQPYPLPEGWKWVRLGSLAVTISKGTTPKGGKEAYLPSGVSFLRVENIHEDGTILHENIAHVSPEQHLNFLKRSILEAGDVLISIAGTLGRTGIVREIDLPMNTNQAVSFVRLQKGISNKYIRHFINSPASQQLLLAQTKVTSIPNLTLEIINKCPIPLPPLDEQERIVTRIESLFTKLDEAKKKAEAVLESYETRKAAILHKAFTGEFSKNSADFSTWEEKTAQELFTYVTSGSRGWAKYYSDSGAVFIRMGNLDHGTIELDLSDIQYVQLPNKAEGQRSRLQKNDILISITADVGMIGLVRDDSFEGYINQHVALARPSSKEDAEFIAWYLVSDVGLAQMQKKQRGATKVGLGLDDIRTLKLKMPPLSEQQRITRILDSLLEKEQQSKEAAEAVLEQIDLMKKAILAKAFRGEL